MGKVLALFISLTFLLSNSTVAMAYEKEIKNLSSAMSESIAKAGKKSIAVVDFTDLQGNVTELGRFLAEEFSVALAGVGRGFEVVDRTYLKTILREQKLATTGLIDPSTAKKLGQIAGVDALITGTITPFGDSIRLSAKILDTSTAKVIGAASGDIAKTKAIEELLGKGIETGQAIATETQAPPQTKAQKRVEVKDFIFELQSCKITGQKVTCSVLITNKGEDNRFVINGKSGDRPTRIIDDTGNEYLAGRIQFGNKQIDTNSSSYVEIVLVSGVPTKASFTFENVKTEAARLSLLEVASWADKNVGNFSAQLRNILLSK